MELPINKRCGRCGGTGLDENVDPAVTCSPCGGNGFVSTDKIDAGLLEAKINAIKSDTENIKGAVASTEEMVKKLDSKVDNLQNTCDKILEIVQKTGG